MKAKPPTETVVIGLGYIGLPTAIALADAGDHVLGVETNPDRVAQIASGDVPYIEPGLHTALARVQQGGRLHMAEQPRPAGQYLIAVPTPLGPQNVPDIRHVDAAVHALAPHLRPGNLVILESTCPVGTTEVVRDQLAQLRPDLRLPYAGAEAADIALAYCPERVLPGQILKELIGNDRCIGGITPACAQRAKDFYAKFVKGACATTTARTAELVKLAENSFRDVNIAFANELSLAAERLGVNIWEAIQLANHHPRVDILQPGPGVGGHCIAVDPWFLIHRQAGDMPLLRTARSVNQAKTRHVIDQITRQMATAPDVRVALLGLSFKADSDDLRESPALAIAQNLARDFGPRMLLVDPYVAALPAQLHGSGANLVALEDALNSAGLIVLLVDHAPFRAINPADLADKRLYDTRGIWTGPIM